MSASHPNKRNLEIYDEIWSDLSDFIKYNPGARHRRRYILKLMNEISFKSVLDVGCGNAELLRLLKKNWPTALFAGADLSPNVIHSNRDRYSDFSFHVLNIENGCLDQEFDTIICSEVIEHLNDRQAAFKHLGKMTKSGGNLIVTAPMGRVYETEKYFGHTTHPTPNEIYMLAEANNFKVIRLVSWGWPFYSILKSATNVRPHWSIKNFGSGNYEMSKKVLCSFLYHMNFFNINSKRAGCQLFALLQKR